MNETKGLVRCVLGFLLAILVIAGGIFGLDVKVEVEDTGIDTPSLEENVTLDEQENVTEADKETVETTVETEDSPADSTPTEDVDTSVDESVSEDVAHDTDNTQDVATEGEN